MKYVRKSLNFSLLSFIVVSLILPVVNAQQRVNVGVFSEKDTTGWQKKQFVADTEYRLIQHEGQSVLMAVSSKGASAYYREMDIDLTQLPYLNWSWKKMITLNPGNELKKSGDDFVARIYVIKGGGLFFWKTKVINYVWSFSHQKKQSWDNPFAGKNARMFAQRDASDAEDQWFYEKRNIKEDFKQLFGQDIDSIDGIAIMTDSDNSGLNAKALYGDIYFSAE